MVETNAVVLENIAIAEEVYSLTFLTEEEIPVRPGQFCMIGVEGYPLRRPIAICKAEGARYTVCYRLKGEGTRALARNYTKGERLSVLLPLGNGFPAGEEKRIAVVGGGAGVFPLISVIRAYAGKKEIAAYMGFRNARAVCMEYEMARADRLVVCTDDGSRGERCTPVQALLRDLKTFRPDAVFACGPVPMMRALKEVPVPVYVSLEERMGCGVGACLVCVCEKADGGRARVCKDGPVFELGQVVL